LKSHYNSSHPPDEPNNNNNNNNNDNNNHWFLAGIDSLQKEKGYEFVRFTRGDGNCFYRAVWYQLCDTLNKDELTRILHFLQHDAMTLCTTHGGYQEFTMELFWESTVECLQQVVQEWKPPTQHTNALELHETLTEEGGASDYCTWFLRALTASWVKAQADRFLPFLETENPGMDVPQFCAAHIEPVGSEATMVAIVALAECLAIRIRIEYLDGHEFQNGILQHHVLGPEDAASQLTLLYRPGHYDILYPKDTLIK
jgi:ubiquitin thioesterase protein OTUB1